MSIIANKDQLSSNDKSLLIVDIQNETRESQQNQIDAIFCDVAERAGPYRRKYFHQYGGGELYHSMYWQEHSVSTIGFLQDRYHIKPGVYESWGSFRNRIAKAGAEKTLLIDRKYSAVFFVACADVAIGFSDAVSDYLYFSEFAYLVRIRCEKAGIALAVAQRVLVGGPRMSHYSEIDIRLLHRCLREVRHWRKKMLKQKKIKGGKDDK